MLTEKQVEEKLKKVVEERRRNWLNYIEGKSGEMDFTKDDLLLGQIRTLCDVLGNACYGRWTHVLALRPTEQTNPTTLEEGLFGLALSMDQVDR